MGTYLNPPMRAKEGTELFESDYDSLNGILKDGESLVGLYDRTIFKNAVHLHSLSEFNEFERQVNGGGLKRIGFFAIPTEWFDE